MATYGERDLLRNDAKYRGLKRWIEGRSADGGSLTGSRLSSFVQLLNRQRDDIADDAKRRVQAIAVILDKKYLGTNIVVTSIAATPVKTVSSANSNPWDGRASTGPYSIKQNGGRLTTCFLPRKSFRSSKARYSAT